MEYGLLVALIGSAVCLGVGATVNELFGDTVRCFIVSFQSGGGASACAGGVTPDGTGTGTGDNGSVTGGAGADASPSPSLSPSPSPSPSPSSSPSPSPSPSPSATP